METKDVYNNGKNDFILKTPVSIFIMQMHRRKVLFIKNDLDLTSQDIGLCFIRTLIPGSYFLRLYWQPPHIILVKNVPEILNSGVFSSDILSSDFRKLGPFYQSFYFQVFVSRNFFFCNFLTKILYLYCSFLQQAQRRPGT